MSRPVVLLAGFTEPESLVGTFQHAGFEVIVPVAHDADASELPDLAVLDCDGPLDEVARTYIRLHGPDRTVPTVLLFSDEPPEMITPTLTDEFALKPQPAEGLVYRLHAMLIRAGHRAPSTEAPVGDVAVNGEAEVIGVFAPKGGVGKTTVAVNLAVALRQQTRSRVLLLDADAGVGNVTAVIAVPDKRGLVDLADSPPEAWTADAFEQLVAMHDDSGVRVITWGSEPVDADRLSTDLLIAASRWARATHDYVVIDTHPGYDDRTLAMLSASSQILLVVTPEIGALRNSAQFIELAEDIGLAGTIRIVANRANHGVAVKDMASALGMPVAATVISSGPRAVQAANEGQPLVLRFPNERVSNDLHAVARLVTRPDAQAAPEEPRSRFAFPSIQRSQA